MDLKISYRDKNNWIRFDGKVVSLSNYRDLFKESRILPAFAAPQIITHSWNNQIFDIQHITYDSYLVEFIIKESELNEINRLQSCSEIKINDLDNSIEHLINIESISEFEVSEPEQIELTANYKVIIKYKINKTIINKINTVNNSHNITTSFDNGTGTINKTFYTDFDLLSRQEDAKNEIFTYQNSDYIIQNIASEIKKVLFILSESEANELKKEFERAQNITLDGVSVLENRIVEYTEIGINLIALTIDCVVSKEVNYPFFNTTKDNTHNITTSFDNGASTINKIFYTDFEVLEQQENAENEVFTYHNNDYIIKSISKLIKKYTFILPENEANELKKEFERAQTITADGTNVKENRIVEYEILTDNVIKLTVDCVVTKEVNYPFFNTTKNNTHNITTSFDTGTGTVNKTFYTDFDVLERQEDSTIEQFNNDDGFNVTTKSISKTIKKYTFVLTEDEANELKKEFERAQTITADGTNVKENRIVEYETLTENVIKVVVNCLTDVTVNYPLNV